IGEGLQRRLLNPPPIPIRSVLAFEGCRLSREPNKPASKGAAAGLPSRRLLNGRQMTMKPDPRVLAAAGALLFVSAADAAFAQKQGGTLTMSHFDSPASMS